MSYADKEIIEAINKQHREVEECQRRTQETIVFKKRQWIIENLQQIIDERRLVVNDEEFEIIVQETLKFMDEQQEQGNIVVNEIQLGGQ